MENIQDVRRKKRKRKKKKKAMMMKLTTLIIIMIINCQQYIQQAEICNHITRRTSCVISVSDFHA
jgi:accessory gene regulator protein AgrB